jgi:hypothetical protein
MRSYPEKGGAAAPDGEGAAFYYALAAAASF